MAKQNLGEIKSQLQKIAQDIEAPVTAVPPGTAQPEVAASPEQVMELVEDAIEILEVAEEAIPAEAVAEEPTGVTPSIGARKTKKAAEHDDDDDETEEKEAKVRQARRALKRAQDEDEEDDKDEKDAKIRKARKSLKKAQEDLNKQDGDQGADKEDDDEKKELNARIALLEGELDKNKKQDLAQEFAALYSDRQRDAKFEEIANSKESITVLERDFKIAQEVVDSKQSVNPYQAVKGEQSGYLSQFKKAKLEQTLAPWKV